MTSAAASSRKLTKILTFIGERPLRQNFLQFACRHQASRDRQSAKNDFDG